MNETNSSRKAKRLLLVYDAPSGFISAVADSAKKLFGQGCTLCAITHGLAGKRKEWEAFEQKLETKVDYLHRDEIEAIQKKLDAQLVLPCVLIELQDGGIEVLLSHITIQNLEKFDVETLTEAMKMWAGAMNVELG